MSDEPTRINAEAGPTDRLRETNSPVASVAPAGALVTEPLLRARDVAALLDVSAATVLDWWERGELAGYKLAGGAVRFDREDVFAWLARQRREATR